MGEEVKGSADVEAKKKKNGTEKVTKLHAEFSGEDLKCGSMECLAAGLHKLALECGFDVDVTVSSASSGSKGKGKKPKKPK